MGSFGFHAPKQNIFLSIVGMIWPAIEKNIRFLILRDDFFGRLAFFLYLCTGFQKTIFDIMKKLLIMTITMSSMILASCNVTRTVTNESQYYQRGDTSIVIQTKTVETYDASKKLWDGNEQAS